MYSVNDIDKKKIIMKAKEMYKKRLDDNIDISDDAEVIRVYGVGEKGHWVKVSVWVPDE